MSALQSISFDIDLGNPICDMTNDPILDMTGDPILDMDWTEWTDVLMDPISITRGNKNGLPFSRVADTGSMKLTVDNSTNNSAGLLGYYSPDHVNCRSNFKKGAHVRINLQRTGMPAYYKFQGRIIEIDPEPGLLSRKVTYVDVVDWMDVAARTPMPQVPITPNQRDDQVMQSILNAMDADAQPFGTNFGIGPYTYAYPLNNVQDEVDKVTAAMQFLANSGLGRFMIIGGATSGEILKYQDIYSLTDPSVAAKISLHNNFLGLPGLGRKAYKRVKRVQTTVNPTITDASPVVLYKLPQSIRIGAGMSATFTIYYHDTTTNAKVRLGATNIQDLVADTDYKLSSVDGSGNDLNGNVSWAMAKGGNSTQVTITNMSATTTGYLWLLQVRGQGIYLNNPMTFTIADNTVKESEAITLTFQLTYQTDYNVAADIGTAILSWLDVDVTDVPAVEVNAGMADNILNAVVEVEPGDIIEVIDDVSGISFIFVVLGYDLTVNAIGDIACKWSLAYAIVTATVLTLDVTGMSELDTNAAKLGF